MTTRIISQRIDAEYERHRHDVFSQTGEDGLIAHFMSRIGVDKGYFVEFGAWDGKHLSNCANLAQNGWSGCFIEGDSERFLDLEKNYADNPSIRGVNCFVMAEGDDRLDSILFRIGAPGVIDVLSIDIDGYDYAVWQSLKDHKPRLVVVEYNPTIPATVVHIQDEHDQTCFGNSLAAFWELGLSRGYRLVASTDWNAFFLPDEDCERFGIKTYFPWEVKDNKYETQFFHGYNGVVKIAGVDSLLWHGVGLDERKMQPLPETLRKIPVGQPSAFFEELEIFKSKTSKNADG